MHKHTKHLFILLCLLSFFEHLSTVQAQDFRTVTDGVEHAFEVYTISGEPVRINLLRLDHKKIRLDIVHAKGKAVGVEKTSEQARRHNAVAAINGGFFRLDKSEFLGEAAGILMIDRVLLSESDRSRAAVFIRNEKRLTRLHYLNLNLFNTIKIGSGLVRISGLDREAKDNEIIKYTTAFGSQTPLRPNSIQIKVENNRVTEVIRTGEKVLIPSQGFVISFPNVDEPALSKFIKIGRRIEIGTNVTNELVNHGRPSNAELAETLAAYQKSEDITNGVSRLLQDGNIYLTWEIEQASRDFAEKRHPRTAIATLKNGDILLLTADGRQPSQSVGMTLLELAEYLKKIGAVDAINLDGGGSTTMYLDGKVINNPSDKSGERPVGDVIIVTKRK